MSEPDEELELQALQRQLDDAFETTRPRTGFEDELWSRMQSSRPARSRLRDALSGFLQGIREVPAVPAGVVAVLLVVVIGVGTVALSGLGRGGGGASSSTQGANLSAPDAGQLYAGNFGRVPTPVLNNGAKSSTSAQPTTVPVQLTWTGKFDLAISTAPVFRYKEPSTNEADQFASALGAVLRTRPDGFLGSYQASDYTLKVRGTVQSPPSSPAYFIFAGLTMEQVQAAGASQADLANIFLAEHNLGPQWTYAVSVDQSADPVKVVYERQFEVPGYGPAYLVNSNGARYGLEVDLSNDRPVVVSGMLPMSLDGAYYNLASPAEAIQPALNPPPVATVAPL